jgi:hypothetical protein
MINLLIQNPPDEMALKHKSTLIEVVLQEHPVRAAGPAQISALD